MKKKNKTLKKKRALSGQRRQGEKALRGTRSSEVRELKKEAEEVASEEQAGKEEFERENP